MLENIVLAPGSGTSSVTVESVYPRCNVMFGVDVIEPRCTRGAL